MSTNLCELPNGFRTRPHDRSDQRPTYPRHDVRRRCRGDRRVAPEATYSNAVPIRGDPAACQARAQGKGQAVSTADWALVISICSAIVSLAGFVWNVWSKFIYPKPRVQVSFSFMRVVQGNFSGEKVLVLSATNMGPVQVTLYYALVTYSRWARRLSSVGLLNPLHNYPAQTTHSIGPFGGGLPKKLDVGEQFSVYLLPDHEMLAKGDYERIGFSDTFGRSHWAPRRRILETLPSIRDACEKATAVRFIGSIAQVSTDLSLSGSAVGVRATGRSGVCA